MTRRCLSNLINTLSDVEVVEQVDECSQECISARGGWTSVQSGLGNRECEYQMAAILWDVKVC